MDAAVAQMLHSTCRGLVPRPALSQGCLVTGLVLPDLAQHSLRSQSANIGMKLCCCCSLCHFEQLFAVYLEVCESSLQTCTAAACSCLPSCPIVSNGTCLVSNGSCPMALNNMLIVTSQPSTTLMLTGLSSSPESSPVSSPCCLVDL